MDILSRILHDKLNRQKYIAEFQEMIWNSGSNDELLSQLAYDLDFYEPNEAIRMEDGSYFGDNELEMLLMEALEKIDLRKSEGPPFQ